MDPVDIKPDFVYKGGIEIFKNVWKDPELTIKEVETECNSSSNMCWERADIRGYDKKGIDSIRTNLHTGITHYADLGNKTAQQLHNRIADIMEPYSQSYMYRHRILGVEHTHEWYMMLKYSGGQKFDAHVDGMPGSNRFLSCILYLNDDYEGGELEFVYYNEKFKMDKGSLIIFPSYFSHAHIAHPVLSGTKYAIVTWLIMKDNI